MRAAACLLALAALTAGCGGEEERKPLISGSKTAVVRGGLEPSVHLFGEPVVARIEVIVNREKADPDTLRVKTDFEPYESVGETVVERVDLGRYTHLRYTTTLRCLNEDCIPRTREGETTVSQIPGLPPFLQGQERDYDRTYEFPAAVVTIEGEPEPKAVGRVVWRPLRSLSRVNWNDSKVVGQGFPFLTTATPLPEPSYRVPPLLLGLTLLAGALALLALPAWLLWERYRLRAERRGAASGPALSPLERALALVEWASRRPSVEVRREALEALAYELDGDERAATAREQGWSPPPPQPEQMAELVTTIRKNDAPAA